MALVAFNDHVSQLLEKAAEQAFQKLSSQWRNPTFLHPSVYDWRKPTRHPKGIYRCKHDPYEWFDPFNGLNTEFCRITDSPYLVKRITPDIIGA